MGDKTCILHGWTPNSTNETVWQLLVEEENQETLYKLPTFFLLGILMVIGLPGNALVLLVYGFRFPASTTKSFIMAMAVYDLINCVIGMPFEMVDLRYDIELDIPNICKIIRFCVTLSACGSVTVLVAVSVDRFRRICRPFQKQMTVKQSRVLILVLTVVSVGFAAPALILYGRHTEIRYLLELYDCSIDDKYKRGRIAAGYQYALGFTWVICIVVLIVMYSFIIYKINLQKQRRDKLSNQSYDSTFFAKLKKIAGEVKAPESEKLKADSCIGKKQLINQEEQNANCNLITGDESLNMSQSDQDIEEHACSTRINRLFSRDVNPIFEERDNSNHNENTNARMENLDEEDFTIEDVSQSSGSNNVGKISPSANQPRSQVTSESERPSSVVREDAIGECGFNLPDGPIQRRFRKFGHAFGSYHLSESEDLIDKAHCKRSTWQHGTALSNHYIPSAKECEQNCEFNNQGVFTIQSLKTPENLLSSNHLPDYPDSMIGENQGNFHTSIEAEVKPNEYFQRRGYTDNPEATLPKTEIPVSSPHVNFPSETTYTNYNKSVSSDITETNLNNANLCVKPINKFKSGSMDIVAQMRKKSSIREIKTSKVSLMMLMVTAAFVLSYLPHLGIQYFKNFSPIRVENLLCTSHVYFVFHHLLMRSFFINNAINPVIYSFYNKTFRERCARFLRSPKSLLHSSEHHFGFGPSVSQDNDTS